MNVIELASHHEKSKLNHMRSSNFILFDWIRQIIRGLFEHRYKKPCNQYRYLNLGCGSNIRDGFCNMDISMPFRWLISKKENFWLHDVTKKWPCSDNYWDGIYTQHMLEHLTYQGAINSLIESFRTLKSGGYIRIVVPDLEKYVSYYIGDVPNSEFEKFRYGAIAISNLCQNAGHISVYDFELLSAVLKEIGWLNIRKVSFMEGTNEKLLIDSPERKWASLYVEAQKPNN